jgi:acyl-CoA synthetase (AMP-forming)/AMP-acid ligase II
MNFVDRLLPARPGDPSRPALITLEAEHSYAELVRAVSAVSRFLADRGVQPGERVGIYAENSLFSVAAYLGAMHAGCAAVPISPVLAQTEVQAIARSTGMRVAFVEPRAGAEWATVLASVECAVVDRPTPSDAERTPAPFSELLAAAPEDLRESVQRGEEDLAALLFSSGSTGKPRGVMLSHKNLWANTESILAALGIQADDRVMAVLPFHYSFGASLLHTHLAAGASIVVDRRFMFPDKVLQRLIDTRCTGFAGVPSHYQILLRRSRFKQMRFPDLRWLQQAGGKLAESFVREIRQALPAVKLFVMYGATEATARIAVMPADQIDSHPASIGKAIANVKIELLADDGKPVAQGEVGEIVVEGPNVAAGYFEDPAETAATFRSGKLHTGDLARADADGYLYVVDRAKSFLKCGGTRTSAQRIEEELLRFPDVVEVCVVGMPDELLGEAVAAFVVARDPSDTTMAHRFRTFAQVQLPPTLQPKRIEIVPALPKNAAGKVMRRELKDRVVATP